MYRFLISALIITFFLSCTKSNYSEIEKEVSNITKELNIAIDKMINGTDELADFVLQLHKNSKSYNLDINNIYTKNGGKYKLFEECVLYKPVDNGGAAVLITGAVPINNDLLKLIRLYENAENEIKNFVNSSNYITSSWIFNKNSLCFTYPYFDVISTLPKKLIIPDLPFYKVADVKSNPDKKAMWTPVDEPFLGMSGEGWILNRSSPVYINSNSSEVDFITTSVMQISVVNRSLIDKSNSLLILLSKSLSVVGSSDLAKEKLKIKVVEEDYYLEQKQTNHFLSSQLRLDYKEQPDDIKKLASLIKSEKNSFDIEMFNNNYLVYKEESIDSLFIIVGLKRTN